MRLKDSQGWPILKGSYVRVDSPDGALTRYWGWAVGEARCGPPGKYEPAVKLRDDRGGYRHARPAECTVVKPSKRAQIRRQLRVAAEAGATKRLKRRRL